MSRRSVGAAIADSRADGPSRRQLMVGSSLAAAMSPSAADEDPAVRACHAWQEYKAERDDLIERWQALEAHLIRDHNWCRLSSRKRAAMAESAQLDAIDDRLDLLDDMEHALLNSLPKMVATTSHGLIAKLGVLAAVVHPQENAEAHDLITSVLRDFRIMVGITPE